MNVYYDMTRTFVERVRGPGGAAGMGRVVHAWGRAVAESPGGSLLTGLSRPWVESVIDSEPSFAWMSQVLLLAGNERFYFPVLRGMLAKSGYRRDFRSKAMRTLAFTASERASRDGIGKLLNDVGNSADFIYHCPLPETLPDHLPPSCIPVINVYDIMPCVFRDTYSQADRKRFVAALRSIRNHGGHIITNSKDTKHSLVCFFNLDSDKVHVVPLGSDVVHGADAGNQATQVEESRPFILYVAGSGQRRKNVAGTILGFAEFLNRSGAAADLIVVGGGTDKFQAYADRTVAGSRGRVRCLGQVDGKTLDSLYESARVGMYLSLYEGFGLPILEYMHRGIPVVCGDATSLPEVAGSAAIMVDAMDAASIGAGITSLWNNPERHSEMVAAGKARAAEFTWKNSTRCLQEVYEKILSRGKNHAKAS